MTQHTDLGETQWSSHGLERQILMIANEMNRAGKLVRPDDTGRRRNAYARVLRVPDLTIGVNHRYGLRRELLRWRDLAAQLYSNGEPDVVAHLAAMKVLLLFTPESARQRRYLLPEPA